MTYTLAQLTYKVARELGICKEGTATGGSVNTVADSYARTEADDFWNGGTIWILRDAGGASAYPEGEVREISDFANTGGVISVRTSYSLLYPSSGDRYAIAYRYVPLDIMIQKINQALIDIGPQLYVYSGITTASNQTEYTLPTAQKLEVRRVRINTQTDTDDYGWMELHNWEQKPAAAGSTDTLILFEQPNTSKTLEVLFTAFHPELLIGTAQLSEHISLERVVYPAVRDCFQYMKDNTGWNNWDEQIARWTDRVEGLRMRDPQRYPVKPGRILIPGRSTGTTKEWTVDMGSSDDFVVWG